jgi:hypothetical protein
MTDDQRTTLTNALEDIQKALRQAKRALKDDHLTDLHSNLKSAHTATSKAKNMTIDVALEIADRNGDDDEPPADTE